jgi:hypothetical protein
MSGTRKAAILISLLGDESAAMILRNLPEDLQRSPMKSQPCLQFHLKSLSRFLKNSNRC